MRRRPNGAASAQPRSVSQGSTVRAILVCRSRQKAGAGGPRDCPAQSVARHCRPRRRRDFGAEPAGTSHWSTTCHPFQRNPQRKANLAPCRPRQPLPSMPNRGAPFEVTPPSCLHRCRRSCRHRCSCRRPTAHPTVILPHTRTVLCFLTGTYRTPPPQPPGHTAAHTTSNRGLWACMRVAPCMRRVLS